MGPQVISEAVCVTGPSHNSHGPCNHTEGRVSHSLLLTPPDQGCLKQHGSLQARWNWIQAASLRS